MNQNEEMLKQNWSSIKDNLKKEYKVTDISFNTWIEPLEIYKVEDHVVTIIITGKTGENTLATDYISRQFKTFFQVMISEFMNDNYEIIFISEKDINDQISTPADQNIHQMIYENSHLNNKYTFENFIVGSNNLVAQNAALAVAENPGQFYNPLYLYGGPGLGKTHLMHSIGNYILSKNPDKKVLYVTSEQFTIEVVNSIRSGNASAMTKLRDKYRTVDILLIDDIQFIIGKESTQEEFFHTFNALYEAGKHIVISSDKPPKDLETLDERFRSRFVSGLSIAIGVPDYETRVAILLKKAESDNMQIDDEIINYIAENVTSNIRELEGSLNKVIAYSKLCKSDINLDLAKDALKDIISPNENKVITPSYIIEVVCEHFNVSVEDIKSKKRDDELVKPRFICIYLIRQLTDNSLQSIGSFIGGRDHSTIKHALKTIEAEIKEGGETASKIETIKKKINPI